MATKLIFSIPYHLKNFTMLHRVVIAKSCGYLSYSTGRRVKVHISRKEHYNDDESPYYTVPKASGESALTNFYAFVHRENWTFADVKHWMKKKAIKELIEDQKFLSERHQCLGPNLAAAHFIAARGGKVKFVGNNQWFSIKDIHKGAVPSRFVPGFYVEGLDASDSPLCYEGLENLCNLRGLKKLIIRDCMFIDDWCLHRAHLFKNTLQFLDISGCHQVTERGISCLHVLTKLETLVIEDNPNIQNKELVCLLLQDLLPKCSVVGVDYDDPILLKRLENYSNCLQLV